MRVPSVTFSLAPPPCKSREEEEEVDDKQKQHQPGKKCIKSN